MQTTEEPQEVCIGLAFSGHFVPENAKNGKEKSIFENSVTSCICHLPSDIFLKATSDNFDLGRKDLTKNVGNGNGQDC